MPAKNPKVLEDLSQRVDEVLHYIWDPIGVSDIPEARDEYFSYVASVVSHLLANENASKVGSFLDRIVIEQMGLPGNLDHSTRVAGILIEWKEFLCNQPA